MNEMKMTIVWLCVMIAAVVGIVGTAVVISTLHMLRRLRPTGRAYEIVRKRLRSNFFWSPKRHSDEPVGLNTLVGRRVWLFWSFRWGPSGEGFGEITSTNGHMGQKQLIEVSSTAVFNIDPNKPSDKIKTVQFLPGIVLPVRIYERQSVNGKLKLQDIDELGDCELIVLDLP